jgi:hypothetical protein
MKDQRVVEAILKEFAVGLQLMERFQKGDVVAHITVGDGVVTGNDVKTVTVTYAATSKDGRHQEGCYDALWFDQHPKFLFHRSRVDGIT